MSDTRGKSIDPVDDESICAATENDIKDEFYNETDVEKIRIFGNYVNTCKFYDDLAQLQMQVKLCLVILYHFWLRSLGELGKTDSPTSKIVKLLENPQGTPLFMQVERLSLTDLAAHFDLICRSISEQKFPSTYTFQQVFWILDTYTNKLIKPGYNKVKLRHFLALLFIQSCLFSGSCAQELSDKSILCFPELAYQTNTFPNNCSQEGFFGKALVINNNGSLIPILDGSRWITRFVPNNNVNLTFNETTVENTQCTMNGVFSATCTQAISDFSLSLNGDNNFCQIKSCLQSSFCYCSMGSYQTYLIQNGVAYFTFNQIVALLKQEKLTLSYDYDYNPGSLSEDLQNSFTERMTYMRSSLTNLKSFLEEGTDTVQGFSDNYYDMPNYYQISQRSVPLKTRTTVTNTDNLNVYLQFNSTMITLFYTQIHTRNISISSNFFSSNIVTQNSTVYFGIPSSATYYDQIITINSVITDVSPSIVDYFGSIKYYGGSYCFIPDNIWSWQMWDSFNCAPWQVKAVFVCNWLLILFCIIGLICLLITGYMWVILKFFGKLMKPILGAIWDKVPNISDRRIFKRLFNEFKVDSPDVVERKFNTRQNLVINNYTNTTPPEEIDDEYVSSDERHEKFVNKLDSENTDPVFRKKMLDAYSTLEEKGALFSKSDFNEFMTNLNKKNYKSPSDTFLITRKQTIFRYVFLFFFIFAFATVDCCDRAVITDSTITNCVTVSPTEQNCQITFDYSVNLSRVGETICLLLNNTQGIPVSVNFTLESYMYTVVTQFLYFTADWKVISDSSYRCYPLAQCTDTTCNAINSNNYRLAEGALTNSLLTAYPGRTYCERRGSGAFINGCGLSNNCIFAGYAIVPQGMTHGVREIGNVLAKPVIRIDSPLGTFKLNYTSQTLVSPQNSVGITNNLNLGNNIPYSNKGYIVRNNDTSYQCSVSLPGTPTTNTIGDIQAATQGDLRGTGVNSFVFDPTMVTETRLNEYSYWNRTGLNSGLVTQIPNCVTFPYTINGNTWTDTSTGLMATVTNFDPINVQMAFSNQITTLDISVVCPVCSFVSVTGCYNCTFGANVAFKAYSSCNAGAALIQSSLNITSPIVELSATEQLFNLTFYTTKSSVNDDIVLKFQDKTCTFKASGTLQKSNVNLGNNTDTSNNSTNNTDTTSGWYNFTHGKGPWWTYLITALLAAGLLILVIVYLVVMIVAIWKFVIPLSKTLLQTYLPGSQFIKPMKSE